jgi:hypothetical protein
MGSVRLGMTVAEAKAAMGSRNRITSPSDHPLLVIDSAHRVQGPNGQNWLELIMAEPLTPNANGNRIATLRTTEPGLSTAAGVAPRMTIAAAEAIHGAATLATSSEEGFGGEWVTFANGPAGIRFEVAGPGSTFPSRTTAGEYASGAFRSTSYRPGSRIYAVVIGRSFP